MKLRTSDLNANNFCELVVVTTSSGPRLVIPRTGTGKSVVIALSISYLLSKGVPARKFLAVTFTKKSERKWLKGCRIFS